MIKMTKPKKPKIFNRQTLELAAKRQKWEIVDQHLPKIGTIENVEHAFAKGIRNPDENVRDFYFSLLEKARIPRPKFEQTMRRRLFQAMLDETAHYAKFRAACALANHGAGHYARRVLQILIIYKRDPEASVREMANKYIRKIEKAIAQKK